MEEQTEQTDCMICFEEFTVLNKKNIGTLVCSCNNKFCVQCVKEYLLGVPEEAHCPHCKVTWTRDFQYKNLGINFVNKTYREHRKKIMVEKEKAKLPETLFLVEQRKLIPNLDECNYKLMMKTEKYREKMNALYYKRERINVIISKIRNNITISDDDYAFIEDITLTENSGNSGNAGDIDDIDVGDNERTDGNINKQTLVRPERPERKYYIRQCPKNECRGMISNKYKCNLCDTHICKECMEISNPGEEHKCDPDNVESAKIIKNETKSCPKCHIPIYKIDGCDQMWCTQCKVAFSWNTGKIETGKIHNPHFYEWMNMNGNMRNPGDVICDGIPITKFSWIMNYTYFNRDLDAVKKDRMKGLLKYMYYVARSIQNVMDVNIYHLRDKLQNNRDNLDLRIDYLMKNIDEKKMSSIVYRRENIREKERTMLDVLELFYAIGVDETRKFIKKLDDCEGLRLQDVFRNTYFIDNTQLYDYVYDCVYETFDMIEKARLYCNKQLENIVYYYKMKTLYINEEYGELACNIISNLSIHQIKDYRKQHEEYKARGEKYGLYRNLYLKTDIM